jgi:hypothetical protein
MNKQTKLLLGVGLVGVGAYMLWKKNQPKTAFAGRDFSDVVGKRKGFVNELPAEDSKFNFNALASAPTPTLTGSGQYQHFTNELPVKDSGWVRADGLALAGMKVKGETTDGTVGKFYDVAEPRWSKYTGSQFFDVKDKGWVDGK